MVCNGVKYYPEKDADSYYARPRSESFNPMTSPSLFLFSYPHTCRKMLTCHFHCQSVTRGIQRERSSAERGLRKRGIYSSPSPFSSSSLEINLVFFSPSFFLSPFLSWFISMSLLPGIINCTIGARYEFINLRQGWLYATIERRDENLFPFSIYFKINRIK